MYIIYSVVKNEKKNVFFSEIIYLDWFFSILIDSFFYLVLFLFLLNFVFVLCLYNGNLREKMVSI